MFHNIISIVDTIDHLGLMHLPMQHCFLLIVSPLHFAYIRDLHFAIDKCMICTAVDDS